MALETQTQDNRKTALCVSLEILQSVISDNQESVHECLNIKSLVDEMELIKKIIPLLTNTEFRILRLLVSQPWKIFSRGDLKNTLKSPHINDRTIDSHIKKIREKMSSLKPGLEKKIDSVSSGGYSFQLGEFSLDLFKEKIEINNGVYFIPQIYALVSKLEGKGNQDYKKVILTKTEFKMFQVLINEPWKIFSRDYFLEILGDFGDINDRTIDSYIKNIRKKMNSLIPSLGDKIVTNYGSGYHFQLGEHSLDLSEKKIEIDDGIYFVPEIQSIVSELESEGKKMIDLTAEEFIIFQAFVESPGVTFGRGWLLDMIGNEGDQNERSIDSHIKRLREKLDTIKPGLKIRLKTEHGQGYKWQ